MELEQCALDINSMIAMGCGQTGFNPPRRRAAQVCIANAAISEDDDPEFYSQGHYSTQGFKCNKKTSASPGRARSATTNALPATNKPFRAPRLNRRP